MGRVVILYGKDRYDEIVRYVEDTVGEKEALVLIPDVHVFKNYRVKQWKYLSGATIDVINRSDYNDKEVIILEPYDTHDMNYYLTESNIIQNVMRRKDKELYILMNVDLNLKFSKRIEKETDGKVVKRNNGQHFKKTILKYKNLG